LKEDNGEEKELENDNEEEEGDGGYDINKM
jgi:hypothetical protein